MSEELQTLLDFVQGHLPASQFAAQFYANQRFKRLLNADRDLPALSHPGQSLYDFILSHDFTDPDALASIQSVLIQYLERRGVVPSAPPISDKLYDVLLAVQPAWMQADEQYVQEHILPYAGERTGKMLRLWLRDQLCQRFRYLNEPPNWLQNPEWPLAEHGPLVFLGQIEIDNYFHDSAAAYVFHDPVSGATETIIQVS